MAALSSARIAALLQPFYPEPPSLLVEQLSLYLDLLLKWNAKTNLTAIRDPEEIIRRHFGESLFLALLLPPAKTLLDLGSGAGFPGLPIQLALPGLRVTLVESQNKKATFLREVVRSLTLDTEVVCARAETFVEKRFFDVVALRAVDDPGPALAMAARLLAPGGWIAHLASEAPDRGRSEPIPGSSVNRANVYQP